MLGWFLLACLPAPVSGPQASKSTDSSTDTGVFDTAGAGDTGDADDSGADTADTGSDVDSGHTDPLDDDEDDDGWTVDEGDCNDVDDGIHPDAEDACDSVDNDCDHTVDEDFALDLYEPNDDDAFWVDLGDAAEKGLAVSSYLHPVDDVDGYFAYIEDPTWSDFTFSGVVTPPESLDVRLELYRYDEDSLTWELLVEIDNAQAGGSEAFEYGGSAWSNDSAYYAVLVKPYGESATCAATYELHIDG